ncbi:hypothetical protein BpHYR1_010786 [Brachionus plicatilis]|uniref:Uncharacterized protein n=1 Tax=Brachionus plicatilis TaxID=10195 RepID=A0A3M7QVL7_BRAPC|nr:hypothetical protein BpHYR1_010786 [Brachionus plicatilis]
MIKSYFHYMSLMARFIQIIIKYLEKGFKFLKTKSFKGGLTKKSAELVINSSDRYKMEIKRKTYILTHK